MNKEKELDFFRRISDEIRETLESVDSDVDKENAAIKKLKEYINENYEAMDVKELRGNVTDVENMAVLWDADRKKLRNLKFLEKNPYFAKISFCPEGETEEKEIYIGTGGFWSEKSRCPLIYDWRAPVSSMYYDYEMGEASYRVLDSEGARPVYETYRGRITEKCQYKISDGRLEYMAETAQRINDELLFKELSLNASEHMHPVVATIQKQQNDIIRDTSSHILVVDGRAGSGKTVIAMHRLAWLLYNKRKTLNTGNVLVISPNTVFSDYVSGIMPELMENPVPEKQWDDFVSELVFADMDHETKQEQANVIMMLDSEDVRIRNIKLKTSISFFDAFTAYIDDVFVKNIKFTDFHYEKMTFTAEWLEKLFFRNFASLPVYERFYSMAYFIMDEYMETHKRDYKEVRQEKLQRRIQDELINRFGERNIITIYTNFLSTVAGVYPGAECYTDEYGKITYEDMQVIFYLQMKLYGCKTYKEVKHCVIDEMQDYSVFQFAVMDMIIGGDKTILGDQFQVLIPDEEENVLDAIIRIWPDRKLKVLNTTYRSTAEITEYCSTILSEEGEAVPYRRHGKKPEIKNVESESEQEEAVKDILSSLEGGSYDSIAVLCDDEGMAYNLYRKLGKKAVFLAEGQAGYRGGVAVMSRFLAKGMEFDAVIVVTESNPCKLTDEERGAYYISCTRALHELYVVGRN